MFKGKIIIPRGKVAIATNGNSKATYWDGF